jgi:hypothetical protein
MVRCRTVWCFLVLTVLAFAQAPPRFVGTVKAVRADQGEVDIQPDQGDLRSVKSIPESIFQRVAPGEKDLKNAKPALIADVSVGDRVLVAVEPGTTDLRRLVIMSSSDIAKRNEADRQDWVKRGLSGVVASKNGNDVVLKMRTMAGETQAVVTVTDKTSYRRYAPDSVKFADALASSLKEINVGDQVKARGDKAPDGSKVSAEEVVFGTFVTKAGKITAVNAETKEITVAEMGTNKPLIIKLTADSQMKKMPDFPMMGGAGGAMGGAPGGMPAGGRPAGMPAGMKPPDMSQMMERMPAAKMEDLQPGQTIVVSSTKGATAGTITAITLLANADMLIRMASMQQGGAAGAAGRGGAGGQMGGGMMGGGGMGGMAGGGLDGLQIPGMIP